jgi:hypothetical protein
VSGAGPAALLPHRGTCFEVSVSWYLWVREVASWAISTLRSDIARGQSNFLGCEPGFTLSRGRRGGAPDLDSSP